MAQAVTCTGCGHNSPADFAFCPRCGRRLQAVCGACGAQAPADFAFCPRCGSKLDRAPEAQPFREAPAAAANEEAVSDRRSVSVLFADVSGFTALSERLDAEVVRAFQNELFAALSAAVEEYGGFVEKYVGDAVMAVFGAPVAHEDDPERALRAALAMRERVDVLLTTSWSARLGQGVRLHVGVHSGPVVAGVLGAQRHATYAVTGDTVNTAARIQAAAAPGEILVSAAMQRATQHLFAFEPREPLRVKGKSVPLAVYSLAGLLHRRGAHRGLEAHGLSAPLIGREGDLGRLRTAFERACRGRTQVVSVIGEAGEGKSRLLTEFLAGIADSGHAPVTVRRVGCGPLAVQTYGVIAELLREGYGIGPDDSLDAARSKLAAGLRALGAKDEQLELLEAVLGYVLGLEPARADTLEPERLQRQIFTAMRLLLEQRLQTGPLVLALEDLHWADLASLDLITHLVDRLSERPLMLVLTFRPGKHQQALTLTRVEHTGIRLLPLDPKHIDQVLHAFFGPTVGDWQGELRALIANRAGGNPLYLEEIVRSMILAGHLARTPGGWVCAGKCDGIEVPSTLRGLIAARLDQIPAQARRLLQEAAVMGSTFDAALLARVTSLPGSLDAVLDTLVQADLLEDASGPGEPLRRLRFARPLLHEVAYESVLVARRTELHGAIAQALEHSLGGVPSRLEDVLALARHYDASAARHKAAEYLVKAGDWAASIYANEDAVRHYERALRALADCPSCETQTLAVRERLGDLFGPMGRRQDALAHYQATRDGFAALGEHGAMARLLRKLGWLQWEAGDRDAALRFFHAGLDLLKDNPDNIERAHLYQELGRCAFRSGDHHQAVDFAQRALSYAERLTGGDGGEGREAAAAVSHAHNTLGIALARMQRLAEAVAHVERSVSVAEANDLLQAAGRAYTNLGVLYAAVDARRSIDACSRGLELAKRIGDFTLQSRLYANLAVAWCTITDRCEAPALEAAQASIRLDRQLDQRDHLAVPLIVLGQIYQCRGDRDLARECYTEALTLAEQSAEPQLLFPCYDGLATLHLDQGDEASAENLLTRAAEVCQRHGLDPQDLMLLPFLT